MELHASHRDAMVQRWALVCQELGQHPDVVQMLADVASGDEKVADVVRAGLQWTLSECNRLGAPVRPFAP